MTVEEKGQFSKKHGSDAMPDSQIKEKLIGSIKNNELPCALAFKIAKELNVLPDKVGITADLMNVKLVKCQLGLFGYKPQKKIVEPKEIDIPELKNAVLSQQDQKKLACKQIWDIAEKFNIHKMKVSGFCEKLGIKIKGCQLGAF